MHQPRFIERKSQRQTRAGRSALALLVLLVLLAVLALHPRATSIPAPSCLPLAPTTCPPLTPHLPRRPFPTSGLGVLEGGCGAHGVRWASRRDAGPGSRYQLMTRQVKNSPGPETAGQVAQHNLWARARGRVAPSFAPAPVTSSFPRSTYFLTRRLKSFSERRRFRSFFSNSSSASLSNSVWNSATCASWTSLHGSCALCTTKGACHPVSKRLADESPVNTRPGVLVKGGRGHEASAVTEPAC